MFDNLCTLSYSLLTFFSPLAIAVVISCIWRLRTPPYNCIPLPLAFCFKVSLHLGVLCSLRKLRPLRQSWPMWITSSIINSILPIPPMLHSPQAFPPVPRISSWNIWPVQKALYQVLLLGKPKLNKLRFFFQIPLLL